jgi:capsule polysaccharide modification protein KpsS
MIKHDSNSDYFLHIDQILNRYQVQIMCAFYDHTKSTW